MADKISESKYAVKRALRRSQLGGNFASLSENEPHRNNVSPCPKPFDPEYFPKHTVKLGMRAFESNGPMKHEKKELVYKFFGVYPAKPTPKRKKDVIVKYDHFKMNYAGWDA